MLLCTAVNLCTANKQLKPKMEAYSYEPFQLDSKYYLPCTLTTVLVSVQGKEAREPII